MIRFAALIAPVAIALFAAPGAAQDVAPNSQAAPPGKAEIEARLAAAFAKYDSGDKGYLTAEDLHRMMAQEKGGGVDKAQSQAAFAGADGNRDDQLSLAEFTGFVTAQITRVGAATDRRGGRGAAGIVARFDETWAKFDAGSKGYLTEDEFVAMMADIQAQARTSRGGAERRRERDPAQVEARARQTFALSDADKNGELTQAELKAHFEARMETMRAARRTDRDAGGTAGSDDMADPADPDA